MFTKRMKIFVLPLFVAIFLLAGSYCEGQDYSNVRVDAIKVSGTDAVKTRATAAEIRAMGSRSCALKMDVGNREEVMRVAAAIEQELSPVDILVNNAAIMDNFGKISEQDPQRWERDLQINMTGPFNCCQAVWPGMMQKKWGRIITISSLK